LPVLSALAPAVNEIQLRESQVKLHAVLSHRKVQMNSGDFRDGF